MSQHEEGQAAELLKLQAEIDAVQTETSTTLAELIQTEAQNIADEAELATMRGQIVERQLCAILRGKEAQA